jgi:hypothetical protein
METMMSDELPMTDEKCAFLAGWNARAGGLGHRDDGRETAWKAYLRGMDWGDPSFEQDGVLVRQKRDYPVLTEAQVLACYRRFEKEAEAPYSASAMREAIYLALSFILPDNCQRCGGARGGVLGNENVVDGLITCDGCDAAMDR